MAGQGRESLEGPRADRSDRLEANPIIELPGPRSSPPRPARLPIERPILLTKGRRSILNWTHVQLTGKGSMTRSKTALLVFALLTSIALSYSTVAQRQLQAGQAATFDFTNITNSAGFTSLRNFGGHGVQAADANGDGLVDIYATNIADPQQDRRDLFFVNQGGRTFLERGLEAGIEDDGFFDGKSEESHAAVFADLDNDGDYDLFNAHTWTGRSRLYRNEGNGQFVDLTESAGIKILDLESRGVAAGDVNGDGLVDIVLSAWAGRRIVIYFNRRSFRFTGREIPGIDERELSNQGITLVDYDGDHDLDLAITGWKFSNPPVGPIGIYRNRGDGSFIDRTRETGMTFEESANGWSFGDLDNDGDLDAMIVGRLISKLYYYEGDGKYKFVKQFPRANFTAALGDLDHDGDLDIYFAGTGVIYENHSGRRFEQVPVAGFKGHGANPRAASLIDIDNDGDLDIAIASKRGPNTIFRNNLNDDNWVQVQLRTPDGQAGAFGAKVYLYDAGHVGDPEHLKGFREARSSTGYCSQDSPIIHFGASATKSYDVEVRFLNGTVVTRLGVRPPQMIFVDGTASAVAAAR